MGRSTGKTAGKSTGVAHALRDVTPLLQALADPTRLGVVQLLSTGPRRAGELADSVRPVGPGDEQAPAGPPPGRGRRRRTSARRTPGSGSSGSGPSRWSALRAWLDQLQAHWDDQLRSFKRHVEGQR